MLTVQDIARGIVRREGGFVNDPDDPGGATKHGVTIHTLRRLGLDLTGDGAVDVADVRALSQDDATDIFVRHYYEGPRINALPPVLQASVFDMYVNSGANAVKILQRLFNAMRIEVHVDGKIGPLTIAAAKTAAAAAPDHLADAYAIARRNYYYCLADNRPASRKYARRRDGGKGGWITRAEEFMLPKYRLSDAEHQERTKAWRS
jgi:lysozyme family protein